MKHAFYILILFLLPLYGFAEETLEQKVRNVLNDKSIADPFAGQKVAYNTIALHFSGLSYEDEEAETEKKELQIQTLTKEKQAAQRILWLTVSLIAVLLVILLIFIRFYQLRRKNLQQSIYEAALLAELRQSELEQNLQEKEHLRKQYNRLEKQAIRNKEKAESYNAELTHLKQQLEQQPTRTMIEKLSGWIANSTIKSTKQDFYIQKLLDLDVDTLERIFLSAHDKLSNMDMKYIICFAIDMEVQDMSLLFNVEPASIYTVRYRIKKKFGGEGGFWFLI